jgi:RNA polymerase sigma-70 factor (ECF subfamily)
VLLVNWEGVDDEELLPLIVERRLDALEALYDKYSGGIFSLAMHMLRDTQIAEEVTQDVFLNVWRRGASYRSNRGKVTAWLFSIAHHKTIDELRRRQRERGRVQQGVDLSNRPSDGRDDPVAYTTLQYESGKLKEAMKCLRPEQREVVMLAYFSGLTHSEIAARLGHPLGTVKTRMRLALRKLREVLGPQIRESADHGL